MRVRVEVTTSVKGPAQRNETLKHGGRGIRLVNYKYIGLATIDKEKASKAAILNNANLLQVIRQGCFLLKN